mgnify:CR=1 FL=1|jgi:hypothetical protein
MSFARLLLALVLVVPTAAVAGDDNPPFEAVVFVEGEDVQVVDADGATFDLLNGEEMLADGAIQEGDTLLVERLVKNPRTVVALEDTHF